MKNWKENHGLPSLSFSFYVIIFSINGWVTLRTVAFFLQSNQVLVQIKSMAFWGIQCLHLLTTQRSMEYTYLVLWVLPNSHTLWVPGILSSWGIGKALCNEVEKPCGHTCCVLLSSRSIHLQNTGSRIKLGRFSRCWQRASSQVRAWEWGSVWLHRSHTHDASPAYWRNR